MPEGHETHIERLTREAAQQRSLVERLAAIARQMALQTNAERMLQQIADEVNALGYAGCAIFLTDLTRQEQRALTLALSTLDVNAFDGTERIPDSRFDGASLFRGESLRIEGLAECAGIGEEEREKFAAIGIRQAFLIPISYQQQIIGALGVYASESQFGQSLLSADGADPFTPAATRFLVTLADYAALALGNARLSQDQADAHLLLAEHHSTTTLKTSELLAIQADLAAQYRALEEANRLLATQATTDSMTGLANHRAFQEEFSRQIARVQRTGAHLSLLLIDVDYFKQYNDAFGHPAGDEVLKTVASLLRTQVREGDFPARYGGEEFAIILPETESEMAKHIAERIRAAIAEYPFANRAVTVSIGLTQYSQNETADSIIQRADIALYEAKTLGRNRVLYLPFALPPGKTNEPCVSETTDETASEITLEDLRLVVGEENLETWESAFPADSALPDASLLTGGLEGLLQFPASLVLTALLDAMDRRVVEPPGHSERVTRFALRLAQEVNVVYGEQQMARPLLTPLTPGDMAALAFGSLLHDIGKSGISDATLRKMGKLTEDEWRQIRRHPLTGAEMISDNPLLARALPVIRFHHERWDGTGYPQGLAGDAIPLVARIFAVCDTLETLMSRRPYGPKMNYEQAREEILRAAGTQFDPDIVEAFLRVPEAQWLLLGEGQPYKNDAAQMLSEAA